MNFEDKVILVTGSSRGIGKAIALSFARFGACVCINYLHSDADANELCQQLKLKGVKSNIYKFDVAEYDDVKIAMELIKKDFGRLDVLINNAGIAGEHAMLTKDLPTISRIIDVNLKGSINCIIGGLNLLKETNGIIINISSANSKSISIGGFSYAASKEGVIAMSRNMAPLLSNLGISIASISLPLVNTDLGKWAKRRAEKSSKTIEPNEIAYEPEEIGDLVCEVCRKQVRYLNGENLVIGKKFNKQNNI